MANVISFQAYCLHLCNLIARVISPLCCYGCTIYMMAILFYNYQSNLDSSQASMLQFNQSPTGRYPSFTFCVYDKTGKLFKNEILHKDYGLSNKDYYDLLSGDINDTNRILPQIKYDKVITGMHEFVEEFEAEDYSDQAYNEWNPSNKNSVAFPFDNSYQDPTSNCFTYNTEYNKSVSLRALSIRFNITKFQQLFSQSGRMYIQAHYPTLMIRDVKTYLTKITNWHTLRPENGNNEIRFNFQGVTLMRFRENAIDPCDPKLTDDDSEWMINVYKEMGCIPIYWNNITKDHSNHSSFEACRSQSSLLEMKEYWPMHGGIKANEVFNHYTKPCNKMILFNNFEKVAKENAYGLLKIKIRIQEEFYQETLNTRAFGKSDLWANIGGNVGIFCGYSILQGTNYFMDILKQWVIYTAK